MEDEKYNNDDDDGPKRLNAFVKEVAMFSALKRRILREKLKKEKFRILAELVSVNKKLKILEEMEEKEKKEKI